MKLAQKCFRHTKERGQARLPNRELITVQVVIAAGTAFNIKAIEDSPGVSRSGRWACPRFLVVMTHFSQLCASLIAVRSGVVVQAHGDDFLQELIVR